MFDRFVAHYKLRRLIAPGERVLVGYSGGPDSTCLVHLLHLAGVDIIAAHLHHGQRDEADAEARLCEAFCSDLGIPFITGKADVPLMSDQMKVGIEEAGRHARYEFFRQASFRLDCQKIATAHTRDDHVETVLLNLTRGTGLSGLSGIPEQRESIIRPLLAFAREETRAYCLDHGLWTHDDPANTDVNFSRARIRHRVVPELRCINPAVDEAVARMSHLMDEEDRYLDAHAVRLVEEFEIPLNGQLRFLTLNLEAAFSRQGLRGLPVVPLRRALKLVAKALGGELDSHHLHLIAQGLGLYPGSITSEGGDVIVEWNEDRVHLRQSRVAEPFRYPLTVPGATDSEEFGWTIEATPFDPPAPSFTRDSLEVVMDVDRTKGPLYFRSAQEGDEVAPLGFPKPRKLSDLLGEMKLTQAARKRLPIICDILGVVWVPGVCLADRVKTEAATSRGLKLRFGPLETKGATLS